MSIAQQLFTRAFQGLHGINPSEARNNSQSLKVHPRMTFNFRSESSSMTSTLTLLKFMNIYIKCDMNRKTILVKETMKMKNLKQKITTFLMFDGQAEEAMRFYTSIFEKSEILIITRYGKDEPGKEGTVAHAKFSLKGQVFMCIDSSVKHEFTFTPAISLYVTCDSEEEINQYFEKLSKNGHVHMPLAEYPFSEKFGWVDDQFGVSWQLILEKNN